MYIITWAEKTAYWGIQSSIMADKSPYIVPFYVDPVAFCNRCLMCFERD